MAVPKKRTGHSAQGKRRSNWKAAKPTLTKCPNCGQAVLAHTVCTACGTYKNKPVRLKDQAAAAEVKEEKKTRKSTVLLPVRLCLWEQILKLLTFPVMLRLLTLPTW